MDSHVILRPFDSHNLSICEYSKTTPWRHVLGVIYGDAVDCFMVTASQLFECPYDDECAKKIAIISRIMFEFAIAVSCETAILAR